VNCGDENAVQFTLKPFLHAQGVNCLQRLVLTHGDARDCGGAAVLNELFGVGELWTSSAKFRSAAYRGVVAEFEKNGLPQGPRHKVFNCGDHAGCWRVLHPAATNGFPQADDKALVLLGDFHGAKILLLSDLSRAGQDELLTHTNDLRADIVIAGLPNEGEPLCDALIDAIQPKVIVIADSEFPATRRAGRALKDRLDQKGIPVIYTRSSGAVEIATDKRGWKLQTMDGQRFTSL
jgi:competence protein ComEC